MKKFNINHLKLLNDPSLNMGKARKRSTKPNARPEKEVEKEVTNWLNQNGFFCHVVESKAVYSKGAGRYLKGQTVSGMPDVIGVCPDFGIGAFVELKAKGRLSNLSSNQKHMLRSFIEHDAFAVCVDSSSLLETYYKTFITLINDRPKAREYLASLIS